MFRRIRTRRAIKAAEANSGLKKGNSSIFRSKASTQQPFTIVPAITAVLSEESESDGATSMYDIPNRHVFDVDMSLHVNGSTTENDIEQMKLVVEELKIFQNDQLQEKDAIIEEKTKELDQTRQDFLEVIVDLSAKEHELSATKQQLKRTESQLEQVKAELFSTKEKLNILGSTLIQSQHKVYEIEEAMNSRRPFFGFLQI
jgi:GTPase involved in cell partitioning and DNA repair